MNLKKLIKWFFFFFWLGLIFYLSSQEGSDSQNLSDHFVLWIEHSFLASWFSNLFIDFSYFIRKSAHFFLYFFLGMITMNLFLEYPVSFSKKVFFSFLFCFFYACSDEIHQLFIPGRSGKFFDVLIDTSGSFFGIFFFFVCFYFHQKRALKK